MTPPPLRVLTPDATPEEIAAITAAIAVLDARRRAVAIGPATEPGSPWVQATRLRARRSGLQRGSWRLSGRIGRRSRA